MRILLFVYLRPSPSTVSTLLFITDISCPVRQRGDVVGEYHGRLMVTGHGRCNPGLGMFSLGE